MPSIYRLHKRCSSVLRRASLVAVMLSPLFAGAVDADIYRSTDAKGTTVFSDQKPTIDATPEPAQAPSNAYSPVVKLNKTSERSPAQPTAEFDKTPAGNLVKTHAIKYLPSTAADGEPSAGSDKATEPVDESWTDAECQQYYDQPCERIVQWKKYAAAACGSDSRCSDEQYLARKYQPVSLQRLQQVARAAAIRSNRQNDEISQFLRRKYTDYCASQSAISCAGNPCQQNVLDACNDPRSLEQLFAHYQGLTPIEKRNIIAQAKALSANGGSSSNSYQQRLGDLLSLLLSQALLGI